MTGNRFKIKIVLECLVALICFVAFFLIQGENVVRYVLIGVGILWLVAALLNFLQLRQLNK